MHAAPRRVPLFVFTGLMILASAVGTDDVRAEDQGKTTKLHKLFKAAWETDLREEPDYASTLGDRRWNDSWPDVSLAAHARRHKQNLQTLQAAEQFDPSELSSFNRLNLDLFQREYRKRVEQHAFRWRFVPLTQRGGIQTADELADRLRFETVKDYEDWIVRLERFPAYLGQTEALMREGIKLGMAHPKIIMDRVPDQIRSQITDDPQKSLFYRPLKTFPAGVSPAEQERLKQLAQKAIKEKIVPAYRNFLKFFTESYLPACHDRVGCWQMPQGREMYAARARWFTTTDLTPKEIHELGLKEVKRIRVEMAQVMEKIGYQGSFDEFLVHLRTDPKFYYKEPRQLLNAYRALSKRIDPTMVKLFKTMPRMPYGVQRIPANVAPDTTTAYYVSP
ncbi:MAG: DUF885 domain-containing protein, partial [Planctomycetales bacterium]